MGFFYYDLAFLIIASILVGAFLYKNRKKLEVESKILLLYRTQFGIKFIDRMSSKAPWLFEILAVVSIACGYILMLGGILLILQTLVLMWTIPSLPKIPPLMPLVPYLPSMFKIDFLPPFYFAYWLISIAIVAISHEFMHGVFSRYYKIKLKSTGFGFLGPFLAAFVEPDEKQMAKKAPKPQLAIISGGSFANLIMSILFFGIITLFFLVAFVPSGLIVPELNLNGTLIPSYMISGFAANQLTYAGKLVNITELKELNLKSYELDNGTAKFYMTQEILNQTPNDSPVLYVYDNTPAYHAGVRGIMLNIDGKKVRGTAELAKVLSSFKPGDTANVETTLGNYSVTFAQYPNNSSKAYLGIGFPQSESKRLLTKIVKSMTIKKDVYSYYVASDFAIFIYNLLLWIVLINVSVMFVNMLPFGMFDGGKFFYLTILAITKSKHKAEKGYKIAHNLILWILFLMMAIWAVRLF